MRTFMTARDGVASGFPFPLLAVLLLELSSASPAKAVPISGGLGFDRLAGPQDRTCDGLLAFSRAEIASSDVTLAVTRFRDSVVGTGYSGFLNSGVALSRRARIRMIGSRTFGHAQHAVWQVRAGPEIRLGSDMTAGCFLLRQGDASSARLDAVGVDFVKPLLPTLSGQLGGFAGRRSDQSTMAGSLGLAWRVVRNVQLQGEINVGRGVASAAGTTSSGSGSSPLPILGDLGESETSTVEEAESDVETVGLLGIRFLIP